MGFNRRILIIDDQEELRNEIRKILIGSDKNKDILSDIEGLMSEISPNSRNPENRRKLLNYDVDTARNGMEALEMVKRGLAELYPYVLCFVDMRMPGWDGTKTAKEIREAQPDIEIVIITAYSDTKCVDIVEEVGIPDKILYLKKPFDQEEVSQLAWALTEKWNNEKEKQIYLEKLEMAKEGLTNIIEVLGRLELLTLVDINKIIEGTSKQIVSLFNLNNACLFAKEKNENIVKVLDIGKGTQIESKARFKDEYPEVFRKLMKFNEPIVENNVLYFPITIENILHAVCVFYKSTSILYPVEIFNMLSSLLKKIFNNSISITRDKERNTEK